MNGAQEHHSTMKINLYILFIICCLFSFKANAQQYPVTSQVIVPRPVPTTTVNLLGRTGEPVLILTNTSFIPKRIMIGATINGNNGISGEIDPRRKRPRAPIVLGRGATITLSGDDILDIFSNYTVFDVNITGINIQSLIQNQLFPEGVYRICVQIYDYDTGQQISAPGSGCTAPLTVRTPDPPSIIIPNQNETLATANWQNITFRWTPVHLLNTTSLYRIKIARVPRGINPYDAINNDNLIHWVAEDLFNNSFLYDISLPKLIRGRYAVQVTAYDVNGQLAIKNEGKSDVVTFNISEENPQPPRLIRPFNMSEVTQTSPQSYWFTWSPPPGIQTPLRYRFRLVDIPALPYARDFINNPSALIYSTEIGFPRFNFRELDPILKVGQSYAWQVQVFDPSGEIVFNNDGYSDVFAFTMGGPVLPAPTLISPEQGELISAKFPFSLSIDWEHRIPREVTAVYEVGIWPFKDGNNPDQLIRETPPLIFENNISSTSFSTTNSVLARGGKFLVRVVAHSDDENIEFQNLGQSNSHIFEIPTPSNHVLDLSCGEGCNYELPSNTQTVNTFEQGDTVRIGNFLLRLTENTTKHNTFYRGSAEIVPGNFFKAPIHVVLNNVQFNNAGIAIRGFAEAKPSQGLAIPNTWTSDQGSLRLPENPAQIRHSLSASSHKASSVSQEVRFLPLEFSGVYITYLKLRPTTATANLVNIQEFSGDRTTGEQHGLFAKRGVCFSAGGPALNEEEAFLPLVNEVTINRSSAYSITLLRSVDDAPYGGTALPYSCIDSPISVHMAGYVSIHQEGLSQNGQSLSTQPIYASFRATYENWLDWQADLHIRTLATRTSCCNDDGTTATLTFRELPDYQLEVERLILDHSSASNPEGLQLPQGSNSPNQELLNRFPSFGTIWNGIYLKEAKWKMPAFASKVNGERVEFDVLNTVLDDAGLSSQSSLITDEVGPQVKLKDWTAHFQGSLIAIQANELVETTLKLNVFSPQFEANIPIVGTSTWNGRSPVWTFSMPEINGLERRIPAWSATLRLSRVGSMLIGFINPERDNLALFFGLRGTLDFDNEIGEIGGIKLKGIDVQNFRINNTLTNWNQRNPFSVGAFRTSPSQLYQIGGYRVFIDEIKTSFRQGDDMTQDGSKLEIDYHFNFDNLARLGQAGIVGNGKLNINTETEGPNFTRVLQRRVWLNPVEIEWAPMEGISAEGIVSYQQTTTGRIFTGNFDLDVLGHNVRVTANMGAIHDKSFWAFTGDIPFPRPVPVFLGLSTHSFGGGIYYNMIKPSVPANGAFLTDITFQPPPPNRNPQNYGIMFSTVLLDEASNGTAFNGRFLLELDMRRQGLEQIRLSGMAHLLDKDIPTNYWINHTEPDPNAAFSIDGSIRFNWPERTFEALAGYKINFDDGLVTGEGNNVVDILVNRNRWHIYLGQDNNRLNAQLNLLDDPIELDAYFMLEGRTDDWTSAFESLQLGLSGSYKATTKAYRVPATVNDHIKFNGYVNFDLEGGFGYNTNFCSNHPSGDFFSYLSSAASLGFSVKYYESRQSIIPWLLINDRWNRWQRWFGWNISGNIALYTPNPTGINLGLTVDIPFWGNKNFNLQLGRSCQ